MLKKTASLLIIFLLFFGVISAQKTAELGIFLGRSYYLGELNPKTHWGNNVGNFTYGGVFRYNLNLRYSLKATLVRGKLSAEDELTDLEFNAYRNAKFESKFTEFAGSIEFNFLPYKTGDKRNFFTPYLFVGFSLYNNKPDLEVNGIGGVMKDEEGGTKVAFPFGPGMKLSIGRNWGLGVEWGFRKTSNDLIDGLVNKVEERYEVGKSYDNDWFVVTGFTLTFIITDEGPCPVYNF